MKKAFPHKQKYHLLVAAAEAISKEVGQQWTLTGAFFKFGIINHESNNCLCFTYHPDPPQTDTIMVTVSLILTKVGQVCKWSFPVPSSCFQITTQNLNIIYKCSADYPGLLLTSSSNLN